MCGVIKTKGREISSRKSVGCKIIFTLFYIDVFTYHLCIIYSYYSAL
jgi:glycerol-3-phosphate responsive antiterminator